MPDPRNSHVAEPFRSTLNGFADAMSRVAPKALPPIREAYEIMLCKLAALAPDVPRLAADPEPDQFEDINRFIIDFARIADAMILAVGKEVSANASCNIDLRYFENVTVDALTGFATHEISRAADNIREERAA